jgi:hypothetical protein
LSSISISILLVIRRIVSGFRSYTDGVAAVHPGRGIGRQATLVPVLFRWPVPEVVTSGSLLPIPRQFCFRNTSPVPTRPGGTFSTQHPFPFWSWRCNPEDYGQAAISAFWGY